MSDKRRRGRPTTYSAEIADEICRRLAEGETLRAICRELDIPASTVLEWVRDDRDGFSERYARARELGYEVMADEIIEIADRGSGDWQRDRLRVDARKWLLAKALPKRYGDRVTLSGDAAAPLGVVLLPEVQGGADDEDEDEDGTDDACAGAHIKVGFAAADAGGAGADAGAGAHIGGSFGAADAGADNDGAAGGAW